MQDSSHIVALMEKEVQERTRNGTTIFTEEIVEQFSNLYRVKEGWESTSYGNDWARGRGLPSSMVGTSDQKNIHLRRVPGCSLYGDERD